MKQIISKGIEYLFTSVCKMRNLLPILVMVSLVSAAIARPALHGAEENEEESEYENEVERADAEDEGLQEAAEDEEEEEETRLSHQHQMETNRNTHLKRASDEQRAEFASYNQNINSGRQPALEEESEQNENSEYNSADEQAESAAKNQKEEPSEEYFLQSEEKSHADKAAENNEHNQEQPRESKTYYRAEDPQDQYSKKSHVPLQNARYRSEISANINRDRRGALSNESLSNLKPDEKDEEAAVKRYIRKLSKDELSQFMGSLTEDKRELLKKIIDSDDNAQLNKRDIKEKVVEMEDNPSEGVTQQSDPNKVEEAASIYTSTSKVSNKQDTPQPDSNSVHLFKRDTPNETTTVIVDNSYDHFRITDTLIVSDLNNQATVSQEPIKTEIKREVPVKFEPVEAEDSEFEDDEDSEEEFQCDKHYKRAAHLNNDYDKMKSLEESFPNSDSYEEDDQSSGSDLTPHVRVKRYQVKKRAAGILPDAKVGFCPCSVENDDEEGNEFDDEGFYDRPSNLINHNDAPHTDTKSLKSNRQYGSKFPAPKNMKSDTANIGSDTDGVLTGVEASDENLIPEGVRRKRTLTKESKDGKPAVLNNNSDRVARSQSDGEGDANPENNALSYHDTAFGALPRNYEGELGRHKRIRHVKRPLSQTGPSEQQIR